MYKLQKKLKVKKEKRREITPNPVLLIDTNTKSMNDQVSPGGIATLKGKILKFNPEDFERGGIYLFGLGSYSR